MAFCIWFLYAALFLAGAEKATSQQTTSKPADTPIVQPGAPGQSSKIISAAEAATPVRGPTDADVSFMQGMIMHHSQAVDMTDLLRTRTHNQDLQALGKRISISQSDEIVYMKQWLQERGKPTEMDMSMNMAGMKGTDHDMSSLALMPGMLTPRQMAALAKANGAAFDHLFLTGMIQHHGGALTMVRDLFDTAGAGQDSVLFDFATDIDNTQRAEIRIMQALLEKEKH
jgi:uncharacterized protein (DUF305 family)